MVCSVRVCVSDQMEKHKDKSHLLESILKADEKAATGDVAINDTRVCHRWTWTFGDNFELKFSSNIHMNHTISKILLILLIFFLNVSIIFEVLEILEI